MVSGSGEGVARRVGFVTSDQAKKHPLVWSARGAYLDRSIRLDKRTPAGLQRLGDFRCSGHPSCPGACIVVYFGPTRSRFG